MILLYLNANRMATAVDVTVACWKARRATRYTTTDHPTHLGTRLGVCPTVCDLFAGSGVLAYGMIAERWVTIPPRVQESIDGVSGYRAIRQTAADTHCNTYVHKMIHGSSVLMYYAAGTSLSDASQTRALAQAVLHFLNI